MLIYIREGGRTGEGDGEWNRRTGKERKKEKNIMIIKMNTKIKNNLKDLNNVKEKYSYKNNSNKK